MTSVGIFIRVTSLLNRNQWLGEKALSIDINRTWVWWHEKTIVLWQCRRAIGETKLGRRGGCQLGPEGGSRLPPGRALGWSSHTDWGIVPSQGGTLPHCHTQLDYHTFTVDRTIRLSQSHTCLALTSGWRAAISPQNILNNIIQHKKSTLQRILNS